MKDNGKNRNSNRGREEPALFENNLEAVDRDKGETMESEQHYFKGDACEAMDSKEKDLEEVTEEMKEDVDKENNLKKVKKTKEEKKRKKRKKDKRDDRGKKEKRSKKEVDVRFSDKKMKY